MNSPESGGGHEEIGDATETEVVLHWINEIEHPCDVDGTNVDLGGTYVDYVTRSVIPTIKNRELRHQLELTVKRWHEKNGS